jgi:hypothetical protein
MTAVAGQFDYSRMRMFVPASSQEGDYFIRKVCRADGNFGQPCRPPLRARARTFIDAMPTAIVNLCTTCFAAGVYARVSRFLLTFGCAASPSRPGRAMTLHPRPRMCAMRSRMGARHSSSAPLSGSLIHSIKLLSLARGHPRDQGARPSAPSWSSIAAPRSGCPPNAFCDAVYTANTIAYISEVNSRVRSVIYHHRTPR